MSKYLVKGIKDFNPDNIFDCGQCFRWTRQQDGSYTGIAMGRIVNMRVDGDTLTIDNCDEAEYDLVWKHYLDMERDYGAVKKQLSANDPVMEKAIEAGPGIRILRQELWETLVSFIISQNNNIPRIKGCIENLSRSFGEKAGTYRGEDYYKVPEPEIMAQLTPADLATIKLGYRAPYLIRTAQQVLDRGGIGAVAETLAASETPLEYLQTFQGVGPKVASCVALFGQGRMEAFPVDVWVRRVMNRLYNIEENDVKAMNTYAAEHFGMYGGIAQQYLFYYIRGLE